MDGFKLLVDTNVVIGLEDAQPVQASLAELVRLSSEHAVGLFVDGATYDDVARDKDEARRVVTLSKLAKFQRLRGVPVPGAKFQPRYAPRARVRALWGLSGWRGNERIADSIKKGPPGARAGGGCCSGSDRAPNFQGSAGRERNPVRGLAQLASLWLIACPASKLRHTCSDHCCRMGADCRELDGPLRPTARLSAIGTFATSTRATGARLKLCQAQAVGRFPAESYSLPIPSFPLQPLRPHNARTRARGIG